MKCTILHEGKGRMRVHVENVRMTLHRADVLEAYLNHHDAIVHAAVYERTGDVVITYTGKRTAAIAILAGYKFDVAEYDALVTSADSRKLNREYQDKMFNLVAGRCLRKLFLPAPLDAAYTAFRSIRFLWKGVRCVLSRRLEVEVLDALSIGVSLLRGDFGTAGSVMFLLNLGSLLEEWTRKKSLDDLARSMALNVDKVWVRSQGTEVLVPLTKVRSGDEVVVRSGNMIPLDGTVLEGEAMVNQAALTGEAMPVRKAEGSTLYAGTVVEEGECVFIAKAEGGSNRYDKIVAMIEESEKLKSSTENRALVLADKLVPWCLGATVVTYLLTRNATRAISCLMVDFSCALKLSMPLAVLSAMRECGSYHITVKGGKYLEALSQADTIVFDKTGTLTLGLTDGAEQLRPGAAEAVRALRARGMELWMISGDKREKAERIAGMLGIENVLCEVRPADKSDAVKALQARGKHVCFVGDGINDSPALACADIGVALGCGADIAISTADVMIVSSSMQSVQTVFDISAATMKNVRQNLIWAAVYNVICIPLAASGIINPSIAAAAMALSSNGVLLNALRLKKYEPRTI